MEGDAERGRNHPDTIRIMIDFSAVLSHQQGKAQEAEEVARAAVSRLERTTDPALDPLRVRAWTELSAVLMKRALVGSGGSLDDAARYISRALVLGERVLEAASGPGETRRAVRDLAQAHFSHGGVLQAQGKWPEAEKASRKALELLDRMATDGGGAPPQLRTPCLETLAACLAHRGKDQEAEELYHEAHSIYDAALGPSHPNTVATLSQLAGLLQETGRVDDAAPLFRRVIRLTEKHPDQGQGHFIAEKARRHLADIERGRSDPSAAAVADLLAGAHISNACAVCGKGRAAGAKLHTCAACGVVPYCSKACQKVDWKRGHKAACTAARAAREGAKDERA
mmetsp:Transcript_39587/g.126373  ORF Transcript_39587/g.126373 Transcript_39587/m.126373 type:complete len:340 (+) Transcript_39587:1077-2096(+)